MAKTELMAQTVKMVLKVQQAQSASKVLLALPAQQVKMVLTV
jgi:hypothetical protein